MIFNGFIPLLRPEHRKKFKDFIISIFQIADNQLVQRVWQGKNLLFWEQHFQETVSFVTI